MLDIYLMIACGGATYFAQPDALKVNKREKERERERESYFLYFIRVPC